MLLPSQHTLDLSHDGHISYKLNMTLWQFPKQNKYTVIEIIKTICTCIALLNFFGSEILAQCDFFGSMKDARIFLGREKKEGFFGVAKKRPRDFLGILKK